MYITTGKSLGQVLLKNSYHSLEPFYGVVAIRQISSRTLTQALSVQLLSMKLSSLNVFLESITSAKEYVLCDSYRESFQRLFLLQARRMRSLRFLS